MLGLTTYTKRPWTHLYGKGLPTDITPDYPTMLDMFDGSVSRAPDSPAIKYFDGVLTMAVRSSSWMTCRRPRPGRSCGASCVIRTREDK